MRHVLLVLTISIITLAVPSMAQPFNCNTYQTIPPLRTAVIMFDPAAPNASQQVVVTVGVTHYEARSAVATLQDNSINVTLTAARIPFATPPPRSCVTTTVGPLTNGTYQVNLYVNDTTGEVPPPNFQGTTTLTVTPDLSAVPTMSNMGITALAFLLSIAGWFILRQRSL